MPEKIFASYSLKKGKSAGPLGAFFYGLGGQPNRGPEPDNNSGQLDPLGLDPLSLGCLPFS